MEKEDQGSCPGEYFLKISDFQFNLEKKHILDKRSDTLRKSKEDYGKSIFVG